MFGVVDRLLIMGFMVGFRFGLLASVRTEFRVTSWVSVFINHFFGQVGFGWIFVGVCIGRNFQV